MSEHHPRKRAPFPWQEIAVLVLLLLAWWNARTGDWRGLAVNAVAFFGVVYLQWRQDKDQS